MKRNLWLGMALLVMSIVLAACQPVEVQTESGAQSYVLGVAQPFTGPLGSFGTDFGKGIDLAVEQMNAELAAAGSNVTFETASSDTEGTPDGAAKAVQTIVQTSGAEVVVGPLTTGEVLGAKQYADENEIVLVAPASSAPAGAIPGDYVYRVMYPPDTFAAQAFKDIAQSRGYENIVFLQVDDPFGNGFTEIFTEGFQADGGGEVSITTYAPDPTDLSGEVSKVSAEIVRLSANGKTAFFCICFLGDAQKVLQLAVVDPNMGTVDWLGAENMVNPDILADAAAGQFLADTNFTSVSFSDRQTPNTQPFVDAFVEKFGSEPGPFTNYAYDAANVAMLSMLAAGNDGAGVKEILPFIANHYIGTSVQTFLDENGDQAIAFYGIFGVSDDGSEFVQIGSYDGATGEVTLD
ncbi:MAG: ABC transporter substrate-binding protein [Caldilineaceae bacterium]|nr:ABC transporter substrate-binding protein [Caldilineaceae bacterium]